MAFRFEQLTIWKDAIVYTKNIYTIVQSFPKEKLFGLIDQLKRSASSIPANIAEGSGSTSKKDFLRYLDFATKSINETVSHLYLAKELHFLSEEDRLELYAQSEILIKRIQNFKRTLYTP